MPGGRGWAKVHLRPAGAAVARKGERVIGRRCGSPAGEGRSKSRQPRPEVRLRGLPRAASERAAGSDRDEFFCRYLSQAVWGEVEERRDGSLSRLSSGGGL